MKLTISQPLRCFNMYHLLMLTILVLALASNSSALPQKKVSGQDALFQLQPPELSGRRLDGSIQTQTPMEDRTKLLLLAPFVAPLALLAAPLLFLKSFHKNPLFRINIDYTPPEETTPKPYYYPPKPSYSYTTAPPPPPPPSYSYTTAAPPPPPPKYSYTTAPPPPPPPPSYSYTTAPPPPPPPSYSYKTAPPPPPPPSYSYTTAPPPPPPQSYSYTTAPPPPPPPPTYSYTTAPPPPAPPSSPPPKYHKKPHESYDSGEDGYYSSSEYACECED